MTAPGSEYEYRATGFTNPAVQRGLDELFLSLVQNLGDARRICDLGCGNGRLALALAARGHEVIGVDSSPSGIALASGAAGPGQARFVCSQIDEALPARLLAEGPAFDAVISSDVVEHLYRPGALVDVAWRILRDGGHLLLGTPYHGYLKNIAISVLGRWDAHHNVAWDGGHIKFFSVRTLGRLVRGRGFEIAQFRFFGRAPLLWKNMICVARRPHR